MQARASRESIKPEEKVVSHPDKENLNKRDQEEVNKENKELKEEILRLKKIVQDYEVKDKLNSTFTVTYLSSQLNRKI